MMYIYIYRSSSSTVDTGTFGVLRVQLQGPFRVKAEALIGLGSWVWGGFEGTVWGLGLCGFRCSGFWALLCLRILEAYKSPGQRQYVGLGFIRFWCFWFRVLVLWLVVPPYMLTLCIKSSGRVSHGWQPGIIMPPVWCACCSGSHRFK